MSSKATKGEYDLYTSRVPPDVSAAMAANEDDSQRPTPSDSASFKSRADDEFNKRLLAKAATAADLKVDTKRPTFMEDDSSLPKPFDSTNVGDEGSKKITAAPQPPTQDVMEKIEDGNDATLRPFNSSELEDESKPKVQLRKESTDEEEGQRGSLSDPKNVELSQRSLFESQKISTLFVEDNEAVGANQFSRELKQSTANASVSPIVEAYLVEDGGGSRRGNWPRFSVYEATLLDPELPWWKQRRTKVFMVINCILITALAVGLGVTFSRSQQLRGDVDAPTADNTTAAPQIQGWFQIKTKLDERFCVDAMNIDDMSAVGDGQHVFIQPCDSNKWSQQWMWDSEGRLRLRQRGEQYCMEAGSGRLYEKMFVSKCDNVSYQKWSILNDGRIQNNFHRMHIGSEGCSIDVKVDECRPVKLRYYDEDGNFALSQTWALSAAPSQENPFSIASPSPRFNCNLNPTLMPTPPAFCGCAACTQKVWDTIATNGGGSFTCGARINWLITDKGMGEFEACEKVSSEFPAGPCGPVCDPSRYSFCGCASCAQRVWGTNALQIVFTGIGAPPNPLPECHGDCDDDSQCEGDLICFQRSANEAVPNCPGDASYGYDFCAVRATENTVWLKGDNGRPSANFPLGLCEGDCDSDADCQPGLVCQQRTGNELEMILGCSGLPATGEDYCRVADPTGPPTPQATDAVKGIRL